MQKPTTTNSNAADNAAAEPGQSEQALLDSTNSVESGMQAKPVIVKRSCTEAMLKVWMALYIGYIMWRFKQDFAFS